MNFVVIDVEGANSARAICQIGIAKYEDGILVDEWVSLINPEDTFEYACIWKHKIHPEDVINAPKFPEVVDILTYYTKGFITVSHGSYDSDAIRKACNRYAISPLDITWLDSTVAARRTWPEVSSKGYGLPNLCEMIGYQFNHHHHALEDAKAAGAVLIAMLKESNQNIDTLMEIVNRPVKSKWEKTSHSREGNPDGILFGEVILFSDFSSEDKKRYSSLASECGCKVVDGYSKKVTILVVPSLNVSENEKTGKYKKVEEGIINGLKHQLLDENEFLKLIEFTTKEQ